MSGPAQPLSTKRLAVARVAIALIACAALGWCIVKWDIAPPPESEDANKSDVGAPNVVEAGERVAESGGVAEGEAASVVRSPAPNNKARVWGRVLAYGDEPVPGAAVEWQLVSVRDVVPDIFRGEVFTDEAGYFSIDNLPSKASVELWALPAEPQLRGRPRNVAAGSKVDLEVRHIVAVGFKLLDASTGEAINMWPGAVALEESAHLAAVAIPAATVLRDRAEELIDAVTLGWVRIYQQTGRDGPSELSAQIAPKGYRPLSWSFRMRPPEAALSNPELVVIEPMPDTSLVQLRFEHKGGRPVEGAHFIMIRKAGQQKGADWTFYGHDPSRGLKLRMPPGNYECGATVIGLVPMEMQEFTVVEGVATQEYRIRVGPSATVCFRSRVDERGHVAPIVVGMLKGLSGVASKVELQSVWPDRRVDEVLLRGLPPGRYFARWRVGSKEYKDEFDLADADRLEIVRDYR